MGIAIKIGEWVEPKERDITRCPSYYAADSETLRVKPGRYPAYLSFESGYTFPMPYYLKVAIETTRVEGRLYNGFGGVNFSYEELPKGEEVIYHDQSYIYQIKKYVEDGSLILNPGFEWVMSEKPWEHENAPKTWEDVARLKEGK